jgi:hypothetical protein
VEALGGEGPDFAVAVVLRVLGGIVSTYTLSPEVEEISFSVVLWVRPAILGKTFFWGERCHVADQGCGIGCAFHQHISGRSRNTGR